MKKNEMEMMMSMMAMFMEMNNSNGNKGKGGNVEKKPRGAMAIYKLESEFDENLYHEIAKEFGCLFTSKNGKKFVGATYENGVEKYTRKENIARIYKEMDARNGKTVPQSDNKPMKFDTKGKKFEEMTYEEQMNFIADCAKGMGWYK